MSRRALDSRIRMLRHELARARDPRVPGQSFGRLMAEPALAEYSTPRLDAEALALGRAVRALAERHGHLRPGALADDGAAIFGYGPAGLLHGALLCLPLVAFCCFERERRGVVVVAGLGDRVDHHRLQLPARASEVIPVLRPAVSR